ECGNGADKVSVNVQTLKKAKESPLGYCVLFIYRTLLKRSGLFAQPREKLEKLPKTRYTLF
ncbi:hypothetical protein ACXWOQ_09725, partial [Streptococcus pyogenes]